jgi:hypothetical protein
MFAHFSQVFQQFRLSSIVEVSTDDDGDDDGEEWQPPSLPASAASKKANVNEKRLVSSQASPLAKPPAGGSQTELSTAVTRVVNALEKQAQVTTQCLGSIIYIYIYI